MSGNDGRLGMDELREALLAADGEVRCSDAELQALIGEGAGESPSASGAEKLLALLTCHRREESGRYYVLLSLAEAATIRCIMHLKSGGPLVQCCNVAIKLVNPPVCSSGCSAAPSPVVFGRTADAPMRLHSAVCLCGWPHL